MKLQVTGTVIRSTEKEYKDRKYWVVKLQTHFTDKDGDLELLNQEFSSDREFSKEAMEGKPQTYNVQVDVNEKGYLRARIA